MTEWMLYDKYIDVYKYKKSPKIEYVITDKMVNKIKKDILDNKQEKDNKKDKYYRFYKMYKGDKAIIAYTNLKMNKMIYNMIKYSLSDKKTYIDVFDDYIGLKIRLLDIYKGNLNKRIIKGIKTQYETNNIHIIKPNAEIKKENTDDTNLFKQYRDAIRRYYKKNDKMKFYIFSIKQNIYGRYKKNINKSELIKEVGFEFNKSDIKLIGSIDVQSNLEGLIYVDKYIHDNKIDQPYYIYKSNVDVNKYVFGLVQLNELRETIREVDYSKIDEYIYGIRIKDKYYFNKSSGKITLLHHLENMYMTHMNDDIQKMLLITPANEIKIDIVKKKYYGSDINLDVILEQYNEKYVGVGKKKNIYRYLYAKKNK